MGLSHLYERYSGPNTNTDPEEIERLRISIGRS